MDRAVGGEPGTEEEEEEAADTLSRVSCWLKHDTQSCWKVFRDERIFSDSLVYTTMFSGYLDQKIK